MVNFRIGTTSTGGRGCDLPRTEGLEREVFRQDADRRETSDFPHLKKKRPRTKASPPSGRKKTHYEPRGGWGTWGEPGKGEALLLWHEKKTSTDSRREV